MTERLQKKISPPKKTLTQLMTDKSVVTGKEVIHNLKEQEKRQKEFEEAVEFEVRNSRGKR